MATREQSTSVSAKRWDASAFEANLDRVANVIGRLGIVLLFLPAAHFHLSSAGWRSTLDGMIARGVPFPEASLWLAMIVSVGATLAILFNLQARWAARVLAVYSITVSYVMYAPFEPAMPNHFGYILNVLALLAAQISAANPTNMIFFLKDLAIAGALLLYSSSVVRR